METITRRNLCDFHRRCLTITQQAKKQLRASTESLPHVVGIYSEDSSLRLYHRSTALGRNPGIPGQSDKAARWPRPNWEGRANFGAYSIRASSRPADEHFSFGAARRSADG